MDVHNFWFASAGLFSFLTFGLHVVGGGMTTARPLLASKDLRDVPKYTNYYCWHIVSILLATMAISFIADSLRSNTQDLALVMTTLAAAFTVWSLALVLWKRQDFLKLPQWILFLPIAACGTAGLL